MAAPSTSPARLQLVEYRQDEQAKAIEALTAKVGQVYSLMLGVLCSVVVACILLAINLGVAPK